MRFNNIAFLIAIIWPVTSFAYTHEVCAQASCGSYATTKYPIVLAHGMLGFDKVGNFAYWYDIPTTLAAQGANVYVTQASPFNTTAVRGEELLKQVQDIVAITGTDKVNLIGHSQGGFSVRYVLGVAPNLVASVTTVGSPNKGTPFADLVNSAIKKDIPILSKAVSMAFKSLGNLVKLLSGNTSTTVSDTQPVAHELSTTGATEFSAQFPLGMPTSACGEGAYTHGNIALYSWNGISPVTNPLDISDLSLAATSVVIGEPSDGMVGKCSSHFGKVLRDDYAQNHLDEVNQLAGLVNLRAEPKSIFLQHANRLKNIGL